MRELEERCAQLVADRQADRIEFHEMVRTEQSKYDALASHQAERESALADISRLLQDAALRTERLLGDKPAIAPAPPQNGRRADAAANRSPPRRRTDAGRGGPVAVLEREEDRRGARRRPLHEIPRFVAVKVSSELVDVINASTNGLLVEGGFPVRPGMTSYVDLIEAAGNIGPRQRHDRPLPHRVARPEQAALSIRHRVRSRRADDRRGGRAVGQERGTVRLPHRGCGRPGRCEPVAEQLVVTCRLGSLPASPRSSGRKGPPGTRPLHQRPDRLAT